MSAEHWLLRQRIDLARETLIELRVHASSAAVNTPAGQDLRHALLERLFEMVHGAGERVQAQLLGCEKGQKLLADLMPLWPLPMKTAMLRAFASQLPVCLQRLHKAAQVPAFAATVNSSAKATSPDAAAALLAALAAHGAQTLRVALGRNELSALLAGLLANPALLPAGQPAATALYALILPMGRTCDATWTLLNAVADSAAGPNTALLRALFGAFPYEPSEMADECRAAHAQFVARLADA